jgi:hypothetical protein
VDNPLMGTGVPTGLSVMLKNMDTCPGTLFIT